MRKPFVPLLAFIAMVAISPVAAQDEPEDEYIPAYTIGDQILSINLGLFFPLFYTGGDGAQDANLSLGGTGHLRWSSFVSDTVSVGGEFGGMFAFTPNRRTLFMIPLVARSTYYIRRYPFEFPLSVAAGVNFSRLEENFKSDMIIMPGAGFYWNQSLEWAFGFDVRYWWIPQIYRGPSPPADATRFGNFMSVTASVLYHF